MRSRLINRETREIDLKNIQEYIKSGQ